MIAERIQRLRLPCHSGSFAGKPQSDTHRLALGNRRLDGRNMFIKTCPNILPALAGMNVCAIRQVNVARKLVEFHPRSRPLFKPVNAIPDNSLVHLMHFHATADFCEQRNGQLTTKMLLEVR